MDFWLDRIIRQSKIPYPIFFGLIGLIFYLLGIPLMIKTGNLQWFLSDYRWVLNAIFGAYNGIFAIFIYRKFSDSLNKIEHLIDSDDVKEVKDKLLDRLTNKYYWMVVIFWLFIYSTIFIEDIQRMALGSFYNELHLVSLYWFIESLPCILLIGIFHFMLLPGLNLAYRDLCFRTPFKKDVLLTEWAEPFKGFKNLITIIMFGAAVYTIFPPNIYGMISEPPTTIVSVLSAIPYIGPTIVLLSAVLFPHYYFHKLFSKIKEKRLNDLRREITKIQNLKKKDKLNEILCVLRKLILLFERGEVEKLKTWLIDIKILGEILVVALMHVILVKVLTTIVH